MKLALLFGCLLLIDCGHRPVTRSRPPQPERSKVIAQTATPELSQILLKMSFDGGLAPGGLTGHSEFVVTRAGNYSFSEDVGVKKKTGVVLKADLDALAQEIDNADFLTMKSKKFTGDCPTANDGQEVTYTFYTQKGIEVIASCQVAIDGKAPLFVKVSEIYKSACDVIFVPANRLNRR